MISCENIVVFYIVLNKIFGINKNIKMHHSFTVNIIGCEIKPGQNTENLLTTKEVTINDIDDIHKYYDRDIGALFRLCNRLQKGDKIKYDSLMSIVKELLTNVEGLLQKFDMITQVQEHGINFESMNAIDIKSSMLRLVFRMSYVFDKLIEFMENDYIKKFHEGIVHYNWLLYWLNALRNNAFSDATTDSEGRVNLETIKFICYSLFQTDEIISRSNRNIVNRMFV